MAEVMDDFKVQMFADGNFDVFDLLFWLYKKQKVESVRTFLIEKLYDINRRDIDFILPQLCHLYTQWQASAGDPLRRLIMHGCASSIHLALKTIFTLQANAFYGSPEQTERCNQLLEDCEMSLVNATMAMNQKERETKSKAWFEAKQQHIEKTSQIMETLLDGAGDGAIEFPHKSPPMDAMVGADGEIPTIHIQKPEPEAPAEIEDQLSELVVQDNLSVNDTTTRSRNKSQLAREQRQAHAAAQIPDLGARELELLQTKQLRSEYFNQELKLMCELDRISDVLVKVPRKNGRRQKRLGELMKELNSVILGLYFCSSEDDDSHYKILSIPAKDCYALSSRDKAPYLMHLEIAYTGHSVYDEDIFRPYKSIYEESANAGHSTPNEDREKKMVDKRRSLKVTEHDKQIIRKNSQEATEAAAALANDPNNKTSPRGFSPIVFSSKDGATPPKHLLEANLKPAVWATKVEVKGQPVVQPPPVAASKVSESVRNAFGEPWIQKKRRLRANSKLGNQAIWDLKSVIFKGGDDCRQEVLAMQLIRLFHKVFKEAKLPLKVRPYSVVVTSHNSGLIETVPNATSIDSLKKNIEGFVSLAKFFEDYFGPKGTASHDLAQRNFVESMAAYSVISYFLQIKDRHNGNIMLDHEGRVIHIDFGFILSNSPGGNMNFESSPFKLTQEFIEVMEGEGSDSFNYFKVLVIRGYLEARQHAEKILLLVEIMMQGSNMPCFLGGPVCLNALRDRFMLQASEQECVEHAIALIEESINNWRTVQYDNYQNMVNNIQ